MILVILEDCSHYEISSQNNHPHREKQLQPRKADLKGSSFVGRGWPDSQSPSPMTVLQKASFPEFNHNSKICSHRDFLYSWSQRARGVGRADGSALPLSHKTFCFQGRKQGGKSKAKSARRVLGSPGPLGRRPQCVCSWAQESARGSLCPFLNEVRL